MFVKIRNDPRPWYTVLGGSGETDSWKKHEVENLLSDSLFKNLAETSQQKRRAIAFPTSLILFYPKQYEPLYLGRGGRSFYVPVRLVSLTAEVQEHGGEVAWRQAFFFNVEHAEKTGSEVRAYIQKRGSILGFHIGMEEVK
jgi:hypothetical protein